MTLLHHVHAPIRLYNSRYEQLIVMLQRRTQQEQPPVHYARDKKHPQVVSFLMEHAAGCSGEVTDVSSETRRHDNRHHVHLSCTYRCKCSLNKCIISWTAAVPFVHVKQLMLGVLQDKHTGIYCPVVCISPETTCDSSTGQHVTFLQDIGFKEYRTRFTGCQLDAVRHTMTQRRSRRAGAVKKWTQQMQTRMQQLKANHNIKIKALGSHRSAQLLEVLCCLQLARHDKPYLPQSIVHRITERVFSAQFLESMSSGSGAA